MIKVGDKVKVGKSTDVWTVHSISENGLAEIVWDDLNSAVCHVDELKKVTRFYLGSARYDLINEEWVKTESAR